MLFLLLRNIALPKVASVLQAREAAEREGRDVDVAVMEAAHG